MNFNKFLMMFDVAFNIFMKNVDRLLKQKNVAFAYTVSNTHSLSYLQQQTAYYPIVDADGNLWEKRNNVWSSYNRIMNGILFYSINEEQLKFVTDENVIINILNG